jgi:hypothetical protein
MSKIKARITVQRFAERGACKDFYRITKLSGLAEIELNGQVRGAEDKKFVAGDSMTHAELKRLCDVQVYEVTTLAPRE